MALAGKVSMTALWHWWYGHMVTLLPKRGRGKAQRFALWHGDGLSLLERRGSRLIEVEPAEDAVFTLRMADRRPWHRHLSMPRAAAPFLRQLLHEEMDRHTPWQAERVYFTASATKSKESDQIDVILTVMPRRWVEPALASLAARGLRADRIQIEEGGPALSLGEGEPLADIGHGRKPAIILGAFTMVALLSLAIQTVWNAVLDIQLADARGPVLAARKLASEADALRRQQHFPSLRRDEYPSTIAVLNLVSQALPDDSWLDEAQIKERQLVISGISAEPAKLLTLLQAKGFMDVQFTAPVTPAEGNRQHFKIRAEIVGADHDLR